MRGEWRADLVRREARLTWRTNGGGTARGAESARYALIPEVGLRRRSGRCDRRGFGGIAEVGADALDLRGADDEGDDLAAAAAAVTVQHLEAEDALKELRPPQSSCA